MAHVSCGPGEEEFSLRVSLKMDSVLLVEKERRVIFSLGFIKMENAIID